MLRIGYLSEPDTLNPIVGDQQIDNELAMFWGGFLFNWSDRDQLVPELATDVPTLANGGISRDGKTIVYHLRRGVLWHDGAPFGADDVIFSWRAVTNKRNNVPSTVGYDDIERIERRDNWTIAVHLRKVFAPFVASFFTQSATPYPVLPAHLLAKYPDINRVPYNAQPIGTGPFTIDRWQRGSRIVFRANPKYWRGPPKLREIQYDTIPDENTVLTQLQAHDIDLSFNVPALQYAAVRAIAGTRTFVTPFTTFDLLALNTRSPVLSDERVRKALVYGLDRAGLMVRISHGIGTVQDQDQPQFSWAYNGAIAPYAYDPARAKALLSSAGWLPGPDGIRVKNGRRLTLVFATSSGSVVGNAYGVQAQRAWRDIGVDLEVKTYATALFFASYGEGGIVQRSKFDVGFFGWSNGIDPDDSTLFMCDQLPPAGQNVFGFCDPALDAAERVALASNDQAVRKRAYATIQAILVAREPMIVTVFTKRIDVVNSDLKNFRPTHAVTDFWNAYDWDI